MAGAAPISLARRGGRPAVRRAARRHSLVSTAGNYSFPGDCGRGILASDEWRWHVSEPGVPHQPETGSLERSRQDMLTAARPLPPDEDAVIEDLTDEEDQLFLTVILEA